MFGNLSGPTLLVILFIVLLLFGAPKLPALARSLGQSMRILKKEVTHDDETASDRANSTSPDGTANRSSDANAANSPGATNASDTEAKRPNDQP